MKVRVSQNRINSILSVIISTEDWSRHELDAIVRFGEPSIQIGGKFVKHCPRCMHPHPHPPFPDHDRRKFLAEAGRLVENDIDSGYRPSKELVGLVWHHRLPCPDCPDFPDDSNDHHCWFELPEQEKKIRSDMPILVEFGQDDFDEPELCAKSWSDEIVRRICGAVEKLRKANANLVKEEVYEF